MTHHLTPDTLSDLAGGTIAAADRLAAEAHLARCAVCAADFAALGELLARTRALPRTIDPPDDVWNGVREAIQRRASRHPLAITHMPWWRHRSSWWLAAAALVLVASSSALTAWLVRAPAREAQRITDTLPAHGSPSSLPARLALVEAGYDDTARELEATLALERRRLSPTTIATVEHSLAVIDEAIAEARRALVEDPSNRALVDIFAANYERKLELLRRATELTSSL